MDHLDCAVIVPAFNAETFIGETLRSIRAQTLAPAEIIVIDDGSSDSTAEVARSFGEDITVIQQRNQGQGIARSVGIAAAQSEWLALCDSDDVWRADHLARRAQLLSKCPDAVFSFSDFYSFGPSADYGGGLLDTAPASWFTRWCKDLGDDFFVINDPLRATLEFNPVYACGLVFRREAYDAMGGFLARYSSWRAEDLEFTRRFYACSDIPIVGDRQQTWGYRRHGANHSADQWRNLLARAHILEAHVENGVESMDMHELVLHEAARARTAAFDTAFWDGEFQATRELYRSELRGEHRTLKRRLRYLVAVVRGALQRGHD